MLLSTKKTQCKFILYGIFFFFNLLPQLPRCMKYDFEKISESIVLYSENGLNKFWRKKIKSINQNIKVCIRVG